MAEIEPERVNEEEHLVFEGMDISGQWNRMFEQRVIWQYDIGALDRIT